MLQVIKTIASVCFFLLLATGLQFFVVGCVTNITIDMSEYSILQWIMQSLYWILAACVGVLVANTE